ncbi:MAG: CRP-like cAMP-binding protein [Paraglaciecola sp.]|jgi:CRP-like cAMP-binding protein
MDKLIAKYDFKSDLIFSSLSKSEQKMLEPITEHIIFDKGKMLFYQDGIPTGVFLIIKGRAKIYKTGLGNKQQIFYIYKAGDLLGYHALLCDERYKDSCEAIEGCETLFISADKFESLLEKIPSLKTALIKNMSHEFGVMVNTISVIAQKSLRVRFALHLLLLNDRFGNNGINLSREDFANVIGVTRESLGRIIKEFKEEGLIVVNKRLIRLKNSKVIFEISKKQ